MAPLQKTVRPYVQDEFIEALKKANHLEVVHTSSDEWPEGGGWPMSVSMRVQLAFEAGKAVVIKKDGSYRYYLTGDTSGPVARHS